MNRGQLRLEVRRALSELSERFFTDREINDWLNEAAKVMTSTAKQLQAVYSFTPVLRLGSTTEYQQEYVMPDDLDEILHVDWYSTSLFPLKKLSSFKGQTGQRVESTPTHWYIKTYSGQLVSQVSGGLSINNSTPSDPAHRRIVVGLWPIPSDNTHTGYVRYYARHMDMLADGEYPAIPPEYRRGLVYYAASKGHEKDKAYGEADRAIQMFGKFADDLRDKMITEGQQAELPRVVDPEDDELEFGGFQVHWAE